MVQHLLYKVFVGLFSTDNVCLSPSATLDTVAIIFMKPSDGSVIAILSTVRVRGTKCKIGAIYGKIGGRISSLRRNN